MSPREFTSRRLAVVALFSVAFAFVEASVVVYLRALYYPSGFTFPLKMLGDTHVAVELARESATLVMLALVALLAGKRAWERFGYFLVAFGVWDIFFYLWLKVILNWPAQLSDWDILFLLPVPWIGPVIAPLAIALVMVVTGTLVVIRDATGRRFSPSVMSWSFAIVGTAVLLWSFMSDTGATLRGSLPAPYRYEMLAAGILFYAASYVAAVRPRGSERLHARE